MEDVANCLSVMVRWVIRFAPLGVMGLVFNAIATSGLSTLLGYLQLVVLLVGVMAFVALVVNPLMVFVMIRLQPLSPGVPVPAGKRHHRLLHPQLGRQYPGEHGPVRKAGAG